VNIGLMTSAVVVSLLRKSNPTGPPINKAGSRYPRWYSVHVSG
jgi:hypothetical protein